MTALALPACEGLEGSEDPVHEASPIGGQNGAQDIETKQSALEIAAYKAFEIGPGTLQPHSHFRTLAIPAQTDIGAPLGIAVRISTALPVPVTVEVHAPGPGIGAEGPDGPLILERVLTQGGFNAIGTFGGVEIACPRAWRVRVRTTDNQSPPTRIAGEIIFVGSTPEPHNLDMVGGTQQLDGNVTAERNLAGIDNTGTIRIKAKWHTDPLDLLHFNSFQRLTVSLLRPNGTVAGSENGFSQHAPSDRTPKVDFTYQVAGADFEQSGNWKLRIRNNTSVRVVDFDIERGLDLNSPSFTSTLSPGCN